MFLLRARRGRTLADIARESGLYDINNLEAARKKFRRDRADLESLGIVMTTDHVRGSTAADAGAVTYIINPDDIALRNPVDFTRAEKAALRLAERHITTGEHSDTTGVAKLTAGISVADGSGPHVRIELSEAVPIIARAVYERRRLTFAYDGKGARTVEPVAIKRQAGHNYFFALDGDMIKTFRADRIDGTGAAATKLGDTFEFTDAHEVDADAMLPRHPWEFAFGDDHAAVLRVDADRVVIARERLGASATHEQVLPDGTVEFGFEVRSSQALRDWLVELGAGAVLTEPPALVSEVTAWLADVAASELGSPVEAPPPDAPANPAEHASGAQTAAPTTGAPSGTQTDDAAKPLSIDEQVALVLAIVPWAFATRQERIALADISREFGVPVKTLHDLLYRAMAWEVRDPSTDGFAQTGFTVMSDEDYAQPTASPHFTEDLTDPGDGTGVYLVPDADSAIAEPIGLTGMEVLSTLMVGHLALELPGIDPNGALASAVAKLDAAFGNQLRFSAEPASTKWHAELQDAITQQLVLHVRYWESSSDTEVELTIEPLALHKRWGYWYVVVRTRDAPNASGVPRLRPLRLERIEELHDAGTTFTEPLTDGDIDAAFSDWSGGAAVTLTYPKADLWRIEKYPAVAIDASDEPEPTITATYHLRSPLIFARIMALLARPDSVVNAHELPAEFLAAPGALAAAMLARYDDQAAQSAS